MFSYNGFKPHKRFSKLGFVFTDSATVISNVVSPTVHLATVQQVNALPSEAPVVKEAPVVVKEAPVVVEEAPAPVVVPATSSANKRMSSSRVKIDYKMQASRNVHLA